jgi:hypothetical protein
VTIRVRIHDAAWTASFERDHVVRIGRGRSSDVRVGNQLVQGRWTVSKAHVEIRWDGTRWSTLNVSDKPGLLSVYEPGYEDVPLEPGRPWVPVRHRWSYSIGRPGQRFHVVCATSDHLGPAAVPAGWGLLAAGEPAAPGIERVNEKIRDAPDAPAIATGRNVSGEIGRWLARTGGLDPDLVPAD